MRRRRIPTCCRGGGYLHDAEEEATYMLPCLLESTATGQKFPPKELCLMDGIPSQKILCTVDSIQQLLQGNDF